MPDAFSVRCKIRLTDDISMTQYHKVVHIGVWRVCQFLHQISQMLRMNPLAFRSVSWEGLPRILIHNTLWFRAPYFLRYKVHFTDSTGLTQDHIRYHLYYRKLLFCHKITSFYHSCFCSSPYKSEQIIVSIYDVV